MCVIEIHAKDLRCKFVQPGPRMFGRLAMEVGGVGLIERPIEIVTIALVALNVSGWYEMF